MSMLRVEWSSTRAWPMPTAPSTCRPPPAVPVYGASTRMFIGRGLRNARSDVPMLTGPFPYRVRLTEPPGSADVRTNLPGLPRRPWQPPSAGERLSETRPHLREPVRHLTGRIVMRRDRVTARTVLLVVVVLVIVAALVYLYLLLNAGRTSGP